MKREYIYLFCSFLIYFSGIGQVVPYTLEWATNIPKIGTGHGNLGITVSKEGLSYAYFRKSNGPFASDFDFDPWLTTNAYANQPWSESDQNFLLVFDADQSIHYGSYLGPFATHSALVSETGNYVFGSTKHSEGIASSGAHQDMYSGNTQINTIVLPNGTIHTYETEENDGYLVKFNVQGQREWGTYLNGTNGSTTISYVVEKDNMIYVGGRTSSTEGFATANAPLTTPLLNNNNQDSYFAAFNLEGTLLWSTYTHQKSIYSSGIFIDSQNQIYARRTSAFPVETELTFSKFNDQGIWLEDLTTPLYFQRMFLSPDDKFYFTGYTTSNEGIATPGTYKSTKTFPTEYFVVCYDINMNKLWGSYLGKVVNYPQSNYYISISSVAFDNKGGVTIGLLSETPGLASENAYQSEIRGSNDFLILSLDDYGVRNWSTYYGGNMHEEFINSIRYDVANNLYIAGTTYSHDLATEGALLETPYIDEGQGFQNYFLAKFSPNPDASVATPETARFTVYPNPATDLLQIRSGTLDTTITAVEVYDLSGKRVLHPALPPQAQQSIDVSTLASGVYLLKIHSADQSQNVRFVKR